MIYKLTISNILLILIANVLAQTLSFDTSNPTTVTNDLPLAKKVKPIDLDGDGDIDIVAGSSHTSTDSANVAWFRNDNNTFTKFTIDSNNASVRTVDVGYINNDSNLDIAAANRNSIPVRWYRGDDINNNSWTQFTIQYNDHINNHDLVLVDLNQDSHLDIVTAVASQPPSSDSGVVWYENNGSGSFTRHIINSDTIPIHRIIAVHVVDLDEDGDLDILLCDSGDFGTLGEDLILWLENDGSENFTRRVIAGAAFGADSISHPTDIYTGDIDGDDDLDVAVVTWGTGTDPGPNSSDIFHDVLWYENDGKPASDTTKTWTRYEVGTDFWTPRAVSLPDIDGDGDLDILAVASDTDDNGEEIGYHGDGGYVSYFINDGTPKIGTWQRVDIVTNYLYAYHAVAEDMDDDGDLDVVASSQELGEIRWWENKVNDIEENIVADTDYNLWNSKIRMNFSSGPSGSEYVKTFYNAGAVPNRTTIGTGIDHLATKGYYTIKTDLASYTMDLEFSYAGIAQWSNITDENDLVMCFWNGTQWEKASNQTVKPGVDSILVTGFSRSNSNSVLWTIGSTTTDNPLPIQLLAFTAEVLNQGVQLNWATASEVNNLGFEIWKAEEEDTNFILLADYNTDERLRGAGNSNQELRYEYVDHSVIVGKTYLYRLVDVDYNHKRTVHKPIRITYFPITLVSDFRLGQNYPNPFNGATRIPFSIPSGHSASHNDLRLEIYNLLGQKVLAFNLNSYGPGNHEIVWNGKDNFNRSVASGAYIYRLTTPEKTFSRRLLYIK
ncbi:MAG: hypothetical protein Kow0042_06590 [Calditrichia bacterium]